MESDGQRLKAVIEKERVRANKIEEEYMKKVEVMQNEMVNMRRVMAAAEEEKARENKMGYNIEQIPAANRLGEIR